MTPLSAFSSPERAASRVFFSIPIYSQNFYMTLSNFIIFLILDLFIVTLALVSLIGLFLGSIPDYYISLKLSVGVIANCEFWPPWFIPVVAVMGGFISFSIFWTFFWAGLILIGESLIFVLGRVLMIGLNLLFSIPRTGLIIFSWSLVLTSSGKGA